MNITWLTRFMSDRAIWEGRYADLWSIPHVISGMLVAFALLGLEIDFWQGLGVSVLVAIAWELFERFTGLSSTEFLTNSIADLLFAQIGFITGYALLRGLRHERAMNVAWALLIVFIACVILGWISYTYYRRMP